jgi:HD-GYP domain-containing protein (c-di-GMP phosphodiesterase class II)
MTEGRSYRSAISEEEALEELRRGAGTQFDPALVRTFVDKVVPALDQSSQTGAVTSTR